MVILTSRMSAVTVCGPPGVVEVRQQCIKLVDVLLQTRSGPLAVIVICGDHSVPGRAVLVALHLVGRVRRGLLLLNGRDHVGGLKSGVVTVKRWRGCV